MRSIRSLFTAAAVVAVAAVAAPAGAQQQAKAEPRHEHKQEQKGGMMEHMSGWKELDAFHMTMMATWHPAKQSDDLAPIREKSAEMVAKAEAMAKSTAPAACATEETKAKVAAIVTDAKALDALVAAKAEDAKVKESLKGLHDAFEVVNKACSKGKGEHSGH